MILDEIQPVLGERKTFDSRIMMLSHIVVMGKGMGGGMPVGAYRINRNDGFIE
jgi:acetylornithine/succinyldiaminopimelate/putrescine aminotransferase